MDHPNTQDPPGEWKPDPYPPAWLPEKNYGNWSWWKKPTKKAIAANAVLPEKIVTWYCATCGRQEMPEAPRGQKKCPACGDPERHRVSRYEWYLADALTVELEGRCSSFDVAEQWAFPAGRGLGNQFDWHFDLFVSCSFNDGAYYEAAIEVDGPRHAGQASYGVGWCTNDEHKENDYREWCATQREGYGAVYRVTNDECKRPVVVKTARRIVDDFRFAAGR